MFVKVMPEALSVPSFSDTMYIDAHLPPAATKRKIRPPFKTGKNLNYIDRD